MVLWLIAALVSVLNYHAAKEQKTFEQYPGQKNTQLSCFFRDSLTHTDKYTHMGPGTHTHTQSPALLSLQLFGLHDTDTVASSPHAVM